MYIRRAARLLTATLACACASAIALPSATASPEPPAPAPAAGPHAFAPAPYTTNPSAAVRRDVEADAKKALSAHGRAAHRGASDTFTVRNLVVDRDGSASVRFDRTYKGLPAYGGDVVVHLRNDGGYESLSTAAEAVPALSTKPGLTASRAAKLSEKAFGARPAPSRNRTSPYSWTATTPRSSGRPWSAGSARTGRRAGCTSWWTPTPARSCAPGTR